MQTFHERISKELRVSPREAWEVIGAINGVDRWFGSMISSCRVEDGKRYCETRDGHSLEEEIIEVDHVNRTFRFGISSQNILPAHGIVETMIVKDNGSGAAIVDWSAEFQATPQEAPKVSEVFRTLWSAGLDDMEKFIHQKNLP